MKKFLLKLSVFLLIVITIYTLLWIVNYQINKSVFSSDSTYELDKKTTILFAGDSRIETAFNDELIPGTANIAKFSEAYIYTYLKLNKFLEVNPQIDTVFLGYSYNSLSSRIDTIWYYPGKILDEKLRFYITEFSREEWELFIENSPAEFALSLYSLPKKNMRFLFSALRKDNYNYETAGLGGYLPVEHTINPDSVFTKPEFPEDYEYKFSQHQTRYLNKIAELCSRYKVKLVLLNTPAHPGKYIHPKAERAYKNYYLENLSGLEFTDFSELHYPVNYFADVTHLNKSGAAEFSKEFPELYKSGKFNLER